jgi:ABC-type methionine transport system ATPase subunit
MAEQVVRLIYPPALLNAPIINLLIRTYSELVVNILRAEVDTTAGWLEVQLVGNPGLIESAVNWLREQGVEVNTLSA